jgi:hypothetical protein
MEMINIKIPASDFSFVDMAKGIAKKVCQDDLNHAGLMYLENHNYTKHRELIYKLDVIFNDLGTKEEQLVYLSEVFSAFRLCWCCHHRCSEELKISFFVILNAVKDLLRVISRRIQGVEDVSLSLPMTD